MRLGGHRVIPAEAGIKYPVRPLVCHPFRKGEWNTPSADADTPFVEKGNERIDSRLLISGMTRKDDYGNDSEDRM